MKHPTAVLALTLMLLACNSQAPLSHTSPTPAASPNPIATPPIATQGPFAVLVTAATGATYMVSLLNAAGVVAASAQASGLPAVTCSGAVSALLPPPISTTNSRVYFMDGQGVVHFLTPAGETGVAATLPVEGAGRSMFSVSADDRRIAVILATFSASGASIKLYVDDLPQAAQHLVYQQTAATGLWPIGWHGASLVVGVVHTCALEAGPGFVPGPGAGTPVLGCCGPTELHVIDPTTAARRFTIGGGPCIVDGPPTAFGTPCLDAKNRTVHIRDWAGARLQTAPLNGDPVYIAPDGQRLAMARPMETFVSTGPFIHMKVCGWVDDAHVIAGSDAQQPARIGDVTTGVIVPIAAQGTCAGRIPGGL